MVTATSTNVLVFKGKSGRIYGINAYVSDVVGATLKLNATGAAGTGSDSFWRAPEPVVLIDAAFITGPTVAVGANLTQDGGVVSGAPLLLAAQLNTLNTRVPLAVGFPAGALIGAIQF